MKKKVVIVILFIIALILVIFCSIFIYYLMLDNIKQTSLNNQRILLLSKVNEINNHIVDLDYELNELEEHLNNANDFEQIQKSIAPFIKNHKHLDDLFLISKNKLLFSYSTIKENFIFKHKLNTPSKYNWILSDKTDWSKKFDFLNSLTLNLVLLTPVFEIEYKGKSKDVSILAVFNNENIVNYGFKSTEQRFDSEFWILNSDGSVMGTSSPFKDPETATKAFNLIIKDKNYITESLNYEFNGSSLKIVLTRNIESLKDSVFPFKLKLIYITINIFIICLMACSIPIILYYDKRYKKLQNKIKKLTIKIDESEKNKMIHDMSASGIFKDLYSCIEEKNEKK